MSLTILDREVRISACEYSNYTVSFGTAVAHRHALAFLGSAPPGDCPASGCDFDLHHEVAVTCHSLMLAISLLAYTATMFSLSASINACRARRAVLE